MSRSALRSKGRIGRSDTDEQLAAAITAAGLQVTPWKVERWRQAGLIEPATRFYLGRGRGSSAVYPEGTVERGLEIASLMQSRRSLGEVALVLFARGRAVPIHVIRAAYLEWLRKAEKWIGSPRPHEDELDFAERRADQLIAWSRGTKPGRKMKKRLRGRDESPDGLLASAFTNLVLILRGEETEDDGITELLEAGGIAAMLRDQVAGVGPIAHSYSPEIYSLVRQFSLQTLRETAQRASASDLEMTRDVMRLVIQFSNAFAPIAQMMFKLPDAFGFGPIADLAQDESQIAYGALVLLFVQDLLRSDDGQSVIRMMAGRLPQFAGFATLLQSLPPVVVKRLPSGDPGLLDSLEPGERERIRAAASALDADQHGQDPTQ